MKVLNVVCLSTLVVVLACTRASRAEVDVRVSANFSELNDHGEWVSVAGYGTAWRPYADAGWRPFMYGHWVYANDGWVWDSDEPFGWIVCHYGNWYYDDDQGWVWLPGYDWSPARVRWYVTGDEIGWAPLFPQARRGFPRNNAVYTQWTFCPAGSFTAAEVQSHITIRAQPEHAVARVHVSNSPPRRVSVQRAVGAPVVSTHLNKIPAAMRAKPLVRVEVQNQQRPHVEVPIGPQFKRGIAPNKPEPAKPVTAIHQEAAQPSVHQQQAANPPMKAEPRPNPPQGKVQDRPRDDQDNQQNGQGDNNRGNGK
jgi:hypothetical protein